MITVIVPCFGDRDTLGRALASLVGQSYDAWECVVVEDGAGQGLGEVVAEIGDERIRVVTLEERRGRGAAREAGLAEAEGEYVAMLDADDWYLPGKLKRQVEVLEGRPELAAVSMGMVVVDDAGELVGVRCCGLDVGGASGLAREEAMEVYVGELGRPPKMAFPPVMMRREVAQAVAFDAGLERSEDWDYLMRALKGRRYGVLGEVGYVYREAHTAARMEAALVGFRCQRRVFGGRWREGAWAAGGEWVKSWVKTGVYEAAKVVGGGEWLFRRRNRAATGEERRLFEEGERVVTEEVLGDAGGGEKRRLG